MDRIIEKLEDKYAYIIIDTPAVNYFTDAVEIAKKVSGMIMVTRYNETSESDVDSAMSRISFFEANMFGFIFNDIKKNKKYNKIREMSRNVETVEELTDAQKMSRKNTEAKVENSNKNNNKSKR